MCSVIFAEAKNCLLARRTRLSFAACTAPRCMRWRTQEDFSCCVPSASGGITSEAPSMRTSFVRTVRSCSCRMETSNARSFRVQHLARRPLRAMVIPPARCGSATARETSTLVIHAWLWASVSVASRLFQILSGLLVMSEDFGFKPQRGHLRVCRSFTRSLAWKSKVSVLQTKCSRCLWAD